jgi:hypothetical protein
VRDALIVLPSLFQHSITPILQYSIFPLLQYSITPILGYGILQGFYPKATENFLFGGLSVPNKKFFLCGLCVCGGDIYLK